MSDMNFSVVIPARNEEQLLPLCINSLRVAASNAEVEIEIIVVVNRCTDRTEELAIANNCLVTHADGKNLSAIRNTGVRATSNKIVLTVDADSRVSSNLFKEITHSINTKNALSGGVMIYPERWSLGIALTILMIVPIAIYYRISAGLFYFTRESFEAIGGFNENIYSAEDIDFAKRLRKYARSNNKYFRTLFKAYITTSCRKFDSFGDWYFILRPFMALTLLKGKKSDAANKIWYDFDER